MKAGDYINSVVGKPWCQFGQGPSEFDCYGLVINSFEMIDGITIGEVDGYSRGYRKHHEIASRQIKSGRWVPSQPRDGSVMVAFTNGRPRHFGRCLCGGVLHTNGDSVQNGKVVWQTYQQINQIYRDIKYYALNPQSR